MPEYSSTTITPADAVQVPVMNGSTPGNATLSSLKSYYLSALGQASGIATLDANGKLTSTEIPTDLDDVLVYTAYANFPNPGVEGKLYIDQTNSIGYIWVDADSAYQAIGTALTQSITDSDTTHAPSSDAVYDAIQTEQTARTTADTILDKRVTNLEQKAGDYSEERFRYQPGGVVPNSKASYGVWTTMRGVTRGWNQLVVDGNFTSASNWSAIKGTLSASGNVGVLTATSALAYMQVRMVSQSIDFINGHIYLLSGSMKSSSSTAFGIGNSDVIGYEIASSPTADTWYNLSAIFTGSATGSYPVLVGWHGTCSVSDTLSAKNVQCIDLTLMFGSGNEPSTVAEALQRCPRLGQYNPYDKGSLVSTTIGGLTSKSRNVWDEVWAYGGIGSSNGADTTSTTTARSTNYISVLPSTTYYLKSAQKCYYRFYDADQNYIGYNDANSTNQGYNTTFTTPSNCFYFRFVCDIAITDGTICINLSDSQNGTYTPYWASTTLSLPSPVELRSAGTDYEDVLDVASGGVTRKSKVKTFTANDVWSKATNWGSNSVTLFYMTISDGKKASNKAKLSNYAVEGTTNTLTSGQATYYNVYIGSDAILGIADNNYSDVTSFASHMAGQTLVYPLATEDTSENIGTLTDNLIYTESGGTLTPVQTQTPEIDTDFSMGFLAL